MDLFFLHKLVVFGLDLPLKACPRSPFRCRHPGEPCSVNSLFCSRRECLKQRAVYGVFPRLRLLATRRSPGVEVCVCVGWCVALGYLGRMHESSVKEADVRNQMAVEGEIGFRFVGDGGRRKWIMEVCDWKTGQWTGGSELVLLDQYGDWFLLTPISLVR